MLNMPASVAVSAINFFFHLENDLLKATFHSLDQQETKVQQAAQTISTNNGGGIIHS
jgi:hypothetical protein